MNQLAQRTRAKHLLPKLQAARSNDETDGLKAPSKAKKKSSVSEKSNLSKARTVTKRRRVSWVRRPAGAGAGRRHHLAPLVQPPPTIKVILLPCGCYGAIGASVVCMDVKNGCTSWIVDDCADTFSEFIFPACSCLKD